MADKQKTDLLFKVLDAMIAGSFGIERAKELKARLEAMIAEGRDPNDEDWADLFGGLDADREALHEAASRST